MLETRIVVYDGSKSRTRQFMKEAEVRYSSEGSPWDDTILVEQLSLPPGELSDCFSGGHTVLQHLTPNRIERINDIDRLERLTVGSDMIQIDPPSTLLGARWTSPLDVLIMIPREATMQRALFEINGGRMPEFMRGSSICDPQMAHIGQMFLHELQTNSQSGRLFGESLAIALAARLVNGFSKIEPLPPLVEGGMQRWRLKRTLEYINDNISEDLSLVALAQVAGLSSYYFCRLFKQSVGLTPHKYIMEQRISRSKDMLRLSKLSISAISEQLGFSDQTHFAVSFRRAMHMTPSEYRFRV